MGRSEGPEGGDGPRRIVFAGSPAFAATILDHLLASHHPVVGVLTQPDRPAGRGRRLRPSAVKRLAAERDLPVLQPLGLRGPEGLEAVAALDPDLLVVAAYGLILPAAVLDLPRRGAINVHASLLPRWRGAAPVERALMAGDAVTGVSIMQMDAGLDTGPVRLQRHLEVPPLATGGEVERALADLGAAALAEVLEGLPRGSHPPVPQPDVGVTYAHKLTREDARPGFGRPADEVARAIRALDPRLPVTARLGDVRIRLLFADHRGETVDASPGTILDLDSEALYVACGQGVLRVRRAQVMRGKARELDAAALRNGFADFLRPGQVLGEA